MTIIKNKNLKKMKNKNQDQKQAVVYYMSEAAQVIRENISEELKAKYNYDTVFLFLKLMDDYYDEIGVNAYGMREGEKIPAFDGIVDDGEIADYIITHAAEKGISVKKENMLEMLNAEFIYLQQIGSIS